MSVGSVTLPEPSPTPAHGEIPERIELRFQTQPRGRRGLAVSAAAAHFYPKAETPAVGQHLPEAKRQQAAAMTLNGRP